MSATIVWLNAETFYILPLEEIAELSRCNKENQERVLRNES